MTSQNWEIKSLLKNLQISGANESCFRCARSFDQISSNFDVLSTSYRHLRDKIHDIPSTSYNYSFRGLINETITSGDQMLFLFHNTSLETKLFRIRNFKRTQDCAYIIILVYSTMCSQWLHLSYLREQKKINSSCTEALVG